MLFPKGSSLLPFFNHAYNKIRQTGALQRIKEKWLNKDKLLNCKSDPMEPISLFKIIFAFAFLCFGFSCAVITLGFENIFGMKESKFIQNLLPEKDPQTMYPEKQFDLQIQYVQCLINRPFLSESF